METKKRINQIRKTNRYIGYATIIILCGFGSGILHFITRDIFSFISFFFSFTLAQSYAIPYLARGVIENNTKIEILEEMLKDEELLKKKWN